MDLWVGINELDDRGAGESRDAMVMRTAGLFMGWMVIGGLILKGGTGRDPGVASWQFVRCRCISVTMGSVAHASATRYRRKETIESCNFLI